MKNFLPAIPPLTLLAPPQSLQEENLLASRLNHLIHLLVKHPLLML